MGNKPEWIIADLAICLLGGIMVAVNTWATGRELQHILSHSDATMLIATDRYLKYDYFAMLEELEPLAQSMPLMTPHRACRHAPLSRLDSLRRRVRARARRSGCRDRRGARRDRSKGRRLHPLHLRLDLDAEGRAAAALRADREHVAHRRAHACHAARPALARGVAVLGARLRERAVQPDDAWRLRRAAGELRAGRGAAHHQRRALHHLLRHAQHGAGDRRASGPRRNTTSRACAPAARSARPSSCSASSISA